ncbi:hypothetical protein V5O48_017281 [Marasmius crinis-equi]|uniref:F-box domain-containing protein n=1 Tax=Marasmius crinis-equi TaxID=585013 RepID=A0ABR3EPL3_9AGAR
MAIALMLIISTKVYNLDHIPSNDIFVAELNGISRTRGYSPEHGYVRKIIPYPSEEDRAILEEYDQSCKGTLAVCELLGVSEKQAEVQEMRIRWAEFLVGSHHRENSPGSYTEVKLENAGQTTRDALLSSTYEKLLHLNEEPFHPYAHTEARKVGRIRFVEEYGSNHSQPPQQPLSHCTGACNLFKTVIDNWTTAGRVVYGLLFSGSRCVLVRVDREESTFVHSNVLPFFPNYGSRRTTTGITAVARLAGRVDVEYFDKLEFSYEKRDCYVMKFSLFDQLPSEILQEITYHITGIDVLAIFAAICPRNLLASRMSSLFTIVFGFQLYGLMPERELIVDDGASLDILRNRTFASVGFRMRYDGLSYLREWQHKLLPKNVLCIFTFSHSSVGPRNNGKSQRAWAKVSRPIRQTVRL